MPARYAIDVTDKRGTAVAAAQIRNSSPYYSFFRRCGDQHDFRDSENLISCSYRRVLRTNNPILHILT